MCTQTRHIGGADLGYDGVTKTCTSGELQMSFREQILDYDFSQVNSTIIADGSGKGQAGVIRNFDKGGATVSKETVFGKETNVLCLPGGRDGGYIQLPNGVLKGSDSCTVSLVFKCTQCKERLTLFSIGTDRVFTVLIEPAEKGFDCLAAVTAGGLSQAVFSAPVNLNTGEWYSLCAAFDTSLNENRITLFINGMEKATFTQKKVSCLKVSESGENFIGYGPFTYESLSADISSVTLHSGVLSSKEISSFFSVTDEKRIEIDVKNLEYLSKLTVDSDITLPLTGMYGTTFTWSSSDSYVISCKGKVTRPAAGSAPRDITLTLTAGYGAVTQAFDYSVTVNPLPTVSDILKKELKDLTIAANPLVSDVNLPKKLPCGAALSYTSSNPEVLDISGAVKRPVCSERLPVNDVTVRLHVSATLDSVTESRDYTFIVPATRDEISVIFAEDIEVSIPEGSLPLLPSRVKIGLSDGCFDCRNVSWPELDVKDFSGASKITELTGNISGSDRTVKAKIVYERTNESTAVRIKPKGSHAVLKNVLLSGKNIFTENKERCLNYLKLLDSDRMLYDFKITFGTDTKGAKPLGGWDEPTGLLRGHSTGHFLSALALSYASEKDPEIKEKLDYMVHELHTLQSMSEGVAHEFKSSCSPDNASQSLWSRNPKVWGKGYLGAYPPDQFALLEEFTPYATIWAPYYTLHKILAGLVDCYTYADNTEALETATLLGDWVADRLSATTDEQRSRMWSMYIAGEYGGMNEVLSTLYLITGKETYLETAKMFDNPKVFEGLSKNLDTISGIHANQHIPQIIGALREYEATGDIKYYRIALAFWKIVSNHYAYSIGGVGRGEVFKEPDILAGNIDSDRNCETCAMYNMLKLTRGLYSYDPDNSAFMDYYERGLINQIAASQNPAVTKNRHHGVTYMLPIGPGAAREYSSDYEDFTCCHGTGMENHVKYQDSIYYIADDGTVYVNLYISSELTHPFALKMNVDHKTQTAELTIKENLEGKLKFRVPDWALSGMYIALNGHRICETDRPGGYLSPNVKIAAGDRITLHFPYSVRLAVTPDTLDGSAVASILYGPFVMVTEDSSTEWLKLKTLSNPGESFTPGWDEEQDYPVLTSYGRRFIPMYAAHNMHYHTYFKIQEI